MDRNKFIEMMRTASNTVNNEKNNKIIEASLRHRKEDPDKETILKLITIMKERSEEIQDISKFIRGFKSEIPITKAVASTLSANKTSKIQNDRLEIKGMPNLIAVVEEFQEITVEIIRFLLGENNSVALVEELADSAISIQCVQKICQISDEELNKAINIKFQREKERIEQK